MCCGHARGEGGKLYQQWRPAGNVDWVVEIQEARTWQKGWECRVWNTSYRSIADTRSSDVRQNARGSRIEVRSNEGRRVGGVGSKTVLTVRLEDAGGLPSALPSVTDPDVV